MKTLLALSLSLLLTTVAVAADKKPKKSDEEPRTAARFKKLDTNSDKKLSMDEFTKDAKRGGAAGRLFGALDVNSDAFLSQKEYLTKKPAK